MISKQDKLDTYYKSSTMSFKGIKDIDLNKRIVTGLFNRYFYIDSDRDMLLPGAASKSIKENGPESESVAKIKHLKDHDWSQNMAKIQVLQEKQVEFNNQSMFGIYHESYYPNTTLANDMLINIQEGIYDNRSIGFNYMKLALADKNSSDEDKRNRYFEYIQKAINPEVAEEVGYFWVVSEIKLWEGSDVTFGANSQTPTLGIKSQDKDLVLIKLFEKMDLLYKQLQSGKQSDDMMKSFEARILQIKQGIKDIIAIEPTIKDTPERIVEPSSDTKVTHEAIDYNYLLNKF